MSTKQLPEPIDQQLLIEDRKAKSTATINAVLVGAMVGIVIWSVAKDAVSGLTLIPVFLAYKLIGSPKNSQEPRLSSDHQQSSQPTQHL